MYRGACLCGAVQFAVEPPYRWFAYCHCSMCRKHHGSLFGAGVGVELDRLRWLSGSSDIVHYRATAAFERPFCSLCGSKVPGLSHLPDVLLVPAGAIEGDFGATPRAHIFVGSKAPGHTITDALPQFDAYPPSVKLPSVARTRVTARSQVVAGSCLCGSVTYEIDGELERDAQLPLLALSPPQRRAARDDGFRAARPSALDARRRCRGALRAAGGAAARDDFLPAVR